MEPLSQFHPFTTDPSWYETYWLTDTSAKPRAARFQGIRAVVNTFSARLRAHMAAAQQARQQRLSLGQI